MVDTTAGGLPPPDSFDTTPCRATYPFLGGIEDDPEDALPPPNGRLEDDPAWEWEHLDALSLDVDPHHAHVPERDLCMGVLADACAVVLGARVTARSQVINDVIWFTSRETHPFSFRWVCEQLHIDPDFVLRKLREKPTRVPI